MKYTITELANVRKEMLTIFYDHFSWLGAHSIPEALGAEGYEELRKLELIERKIKKVLDSIKKK